MELALLISLYMRIVTIKAFYSILFYDIKHDIQLIRLEKHCLKVKKAPVNQFKVENILP